jgi:hypothetical protein
MIDFIKNKTIAMRKSGTLYFSLTRQDEYIIARNNVNTSRIFHEVFAERVVGEDTLLFEKLMDEIAKSELDQLNLSGYKKSDWKAFQASGTKTIKAFETEFVPIFIVAFNESNLLYDAYSTFSEPVEYTLHVTLNPARLDEVRQKLLFLLERTKQILEQNNRKSIDTVK